jgi:signal transduction histidine kinase
VRIVRTALAPLHRRSTYRRLMFLLLGSAAAVGFASIGALVVGSMLPAGSAPATQVVQIAGPLVPILPVAVAIGMLRSTLVIQRTLARALLGVPAADLPANATISAGHRWRSAAFFVLHMLAGYVLGLLILLICGFILITLAAFTGPQTFGDPVGPSTPAEFRRLGPPIILTLLLALPYTAALLGAGFARLATRLLGPTPDERLAALRLRVRSLAEHNRLARELHDSVGHALSVVAVQAGAAQRVLDHDPEVARTALATIADSARRALDDLDHVLALLRAEPGHPADGVQWTLSNLDTLLADVRAAGLTVDLRCTGDLAAVPAVVSREAYRIVQEGLTNALRHAGPVPVTLVIRSDPSGLAMELSNYLPDHGPGEREGGGAPSPRWQSVVGAERETSGRGLTGIRERVALLGGTVSAGPRDGRWRVAVHLP